jgi:hypothetical protein
MPTTIYLYYGKLAASSVSDGEATFEVYDGFEDDDVGSIPAAPSPESWTKYAGNPVIDCDRCAFGSTFYDSDTGIYHNFVSWGSILHYTSDDGINWTADDANNPVLTASQSWEGSNVGVPMVWKEEGTWYMLYRGGSPDRIGLATSSDAVHWNKSGENPVLSGDSGAWDDRALDPWGVIKVGSTYYLWYNTIGGVPGLGRCTGLATSTNLTDWTKDPSNPIFTGGRFCAFPFKYADMYYLLVPHYTSGSNYSQIELYRDSSPTFYPAEREYLGVAIDYGPTDWDDHDQDTPSVLTDDIYRDTFDASGNQLWVYYGGEGGEGWGQTGMVIEEDIAEAIAGIQPNVLTWSTTGDVTVVDAPVHQGVRSVLQHDTSSGSTQLRGSFAEMDRGVVGAWMRRSSTSNGDYDIYLYDGSALSCVAGLGRDGDFHYWNGDFQPTGISWAPDTWYLVTLAFDATTDLYDFVVYGEDLTELVRVEGIAFGNASSAIDTAWLYTSGGFVEDGYGDDFRVRQYCGADPTVAVGAEEALGTIQAYKYNDVDQSGERDDGEPWLDGWEFTVYQGDGVVATGTTDGNGIVSFEDLTSGIYRVCETPQEGWDNSDPGDESIDPARPCVEVTIDNSSLNPSVMFGNYEEEPTAITLASFNADAGVGSVMLTWETGTEVDNAGFNLYRATAEVGTYTKINDALIAAEGDPVSGASYSFLDEGVSAGAYYYKLEDVDLNGITTLHGPVSVTVLPRFRRPERRPEAP